MVLSRKEKIKGIKFYIYNYEKDEILPQSFSNYSEALKVFNLLNLEGIGTIIKI